jgi:hypothetical protein
MRWLLKSQFDKNLIVINHKPNDNFKSHVIFGEIQERLLTLPFNDYDGCNSHKKLNALNCMREDSYRTVQRFFQSPSSC